MRNEFSGLINAVTTRRPPTVGGGLPVVGGVSVPFGGPKH